MKILVLSAPFLLANLDTGEAGQYPVQSDINFHITTSLKALGHSVVEVSFRHENAHISIDVEDAFEGEYDYAFLDINQTPCFFEPVLLTHIQNIRERVNKLFIVIPDFYLSRHEQITKLLTLYGPYADKVITFYEASQDVSRMLGVAGETVDKIISVDVPTCWNEPSTNALYDVCYIGSAKVSRTIPFASLLIAKPDLRCFLSTAGRAGDSNPNILNTTTSYLDVLRTSKTSIISPASSSPIFKLPSASSNPIWIHTPSPMPGRLSEMVSCGAVPIWIGDSEKLPYPLSEGVIPSFVFRLGSFEPLTVINGILGVDRQALLKVLKECWRQYFSPEVFMSKVLG